jgi:hypothetical protein
MKSKALLIMIGGALALTLTFAFARVGESEAQVDHRYGKPAGKWDDYLGYKKLYHWHGFEVMVTFTDGVSQREMFNKGASLLPHDKKYLRKVAGVGRNDVIYDERDGTFTTKAFEDKYIAARTAAWEKAKQKPE